MIDLAGMPSYVWLTPPRLRQPVQDHVPYTTLALRQDLLRVRSARNDCQAKRDRDAAETRVIERARKSLRLQNICPSDHDEPFAAIIRCTSDPAKVDKRTRSKWSRVLRYAMEYKPSSEPLAAFVQRKGGINKCAERFARFLGRGGQY